MAENMQNEMKNEHRKQLCPLLYFYLHHTHGRAFILAVHSLPAEDDKEEKKKHSWTF